MAKSRKEIIESYFRIIDKKKNLVDFNQNFIQNKLDEIREDLKRKGKPSWLLILKARQEGVSVKLMADFVADCVNPKIGNIVATLISHEGEATKRLFRKARINIDHAKLPIQTKTDSAREIEFPETNSWFYILTAGSRAGGRGDTILLDIDFFSARSSNSSSVCSLKNASASHSASALS